MGSNNLSTLSVLGILASGVIAGTVAGLAVLWLGPNPVRAPVLREGPSERIAPEFDEIRDALRAMDERLGFIEASLAGSVRTTVSSPPDRAADFEALAPLPDLVEEVRALRRTLAASGINAWTQSDLEVARSMNPQPNHAAVQRAREQIDGTSDGYLNYLWMTVPDAIRMFGSPSEVKVMRRSDAPTRQLFIYRLADDASVILEVVVENGLVTDVW